MVDGVNNRILFVDDDVSTHWPVTDILSNAGYVVTGVSRGEAAIKCLHLRASDFDLLLTDVALPGGPNGMQIVELWRRLRPGQPVIYTTGHADDVLDILEGRDGFLRKPFTADQMLRAVLKSVGPEAERRDR